MKNKNIMEFIEFFAYFYGTVNRENIINKFNISPASATNILSQYNKEAPKNLDYNINLKRYEISKSFTPIFNNHILYELMPVYTIPSLYNSIDSNDIAQVAIISRAIQRVYALTITYSSLSGKISTRQIVPVAFASTHLRWHLRAYDRKRNQFTDFVLRRILKVMPIKKDVIKNHEHPNKDKQWHSFINLKIKSHPTNASNFHNINSNIKIRSAMAGYFLQLWNIDCSPNFILRGKQYQYILENIKEVSQIADLKLTPGYNKKPNNKHKR